MQSRIIKAETQHCAELASRLDKAASDFIKNYWQIDPKAGLLKSLSDSILCWSILLDGKVAGMFGCTREGNVWLTTAPDINNKTAIRFIRQSQGYIKRMQEECGELFCYAHKDNIKLINWLLWSGFEITGEIGDFKSCVLHLQQG